MTGIATWVCPNGHTTRARIEPYNSCTECGVDKWRPQRGSRA